MAKSNLLAFLVFNFFFGLSNVWGQDLQSVSSRYVVFDQIIGKTNSGIYNGIEYYERFPMRNEKHKFFNSPNFEIGSLIFDGQPYFQVALLYDVYDDLLLIKNLEVLGSPITILDKNRVKEFRLGLHEFKNMVFTTVKNNKVSGFFEPLLTNKTTVLYKKHEKKINKKIENGVYYEFKDQASYYLKLGKEYYYIKNDNALAAIFPQYQADLKVLFQQNRNIKKTNYDQYLISILKELKSIAH